MQHCGAARACCPVTRQTGSPRTTTQATKCPSGCGFRRFRHRCAASLRWSAGCALATLRDAAVPSFPQNPQNKFCGFVRFPLPVCPPFGRIPSFPPSPGRMMAQCAAPSFMAQLRPGLFYFVCLLSLCVPSWAVFRRWLLPSSFPVSFSPLGRRKARSWFAGFPLWNHPGKTYSFLAAVPSFPAPSHCTGQSRPSPKGVLRSLDMPGKIF